MPDPVQVNYNAGNSGVSSWREVEILDINDDQKLAVCQDTHRGTMTVTTRYHTGRSPAIGDRWILERKYGLWLFTYFVEPDSA